MSERIKLSVTRLLEVATRAGGLSTAEAHDIGALLLAAAPQPFDPQAGSRLNNDGSPLQLSLSCTRDGVRLRVLGDPCAGEVDPEQQRARAVAGLDGVLQAKAPELAASGRRTLDIVVPEPRTRIAGVGLEAFTSGIVWMGAAARGPGAAFYVDVRPHGERSFDLAADWLDDMLLGGTEARAVLDGMRGTAELASIGLEGYRRADARAKIYLRLRDAGDALAALGVPLLESPQIQTFLHEVMGRAALDREGLLLGVGFRLADGRLADAKADMCAHCLPYGADDWELVTRSLAERLGLADPRLDDVLSGGACEVAFVGLGVDVEGEPRLNVYLKADPARGPVTPERVEAALTDGIAALARQQEPDGRWQDYPDLPVGPSDQWVTAYTGHALAGVAARTGSDVAAVAARRAADALAVRTYEAGWGYHASTGPDSDSTALALRLQTLVGATVHERDREFLERHWRDGGGFATYLRDSGWGVAHPDVTPLAFLALTPPRQAALREELETFLSRTRRDDGLWPSYWWRAPYYATYQVLRLITELGGPVLPNPTEPAHLEPGNAFELACVLGIETLRAGGSSLPETVVGELLARQRLDGRWQGSENLRVTDEGVMSGSPDAAGRCYADVEGTITTATALETLARVVSNGTQLPDHQPSTRHTEGARHAATVPR